MGVAEPDLRRALQEARAAHARGDWRTLHDTLAGARTRGLPLPAEAVGELGMAAWWLGETQESIRLAEEAHAGFLAEGRADLAAAAAVRVSIIAMLRGHEALGEGWLSRARRLLDGREECAAHGLVAYVDCLMALTSFDLTAAREGGTRLQALGSRLVDPTLSSLGLMLEGVALARSGEVAAGFSLLDEAMLPVVGGTVLPEFTGAIYCLAISTCTELADLARAWRWTEATERWCAQFSDAVMYLGICRVQRAYLMGQEGSWRASEQEALRVCEDLSDVNRSVVAEGFYQVGEVRRLRGDLEPALEAYRRARALGRVPQPGEALLRLAAGRAIQAWAALESDTALCPDDPFTRSRLHFARVEIALAVGRTGDAEWSAEQVAVVAERFASEGLLNRARHASGMVLLAQERPREAMALFSDARRY